MILDKYKIKSIKQVINLKNYKAFTSIWNGLIQVLNTSITASDSNISLLANSKVDKRVAVLTLTTPYAVDVSVEGLTLHCANTLTVVLPTGLPAGFIVRFRNTISAGGTVTFSAAGGCTLNGEGGFTKLDTINRVSEIVHVGGDIWYATNLES